MGVIRQLSRDGLDADQLGNVEIVLAEVINNVVKHAYQNGEEGEISVSYCLSVNELTLHVRDQGVAFQNEELPPGMLPDIDVPLLEMPEGGFGWALIKTLTSKVRYVREKGWNTLALSFDLTTA